MYSIQVLAFTDTPLSEKDTKAQIESVDLTFFKAHERLYIYIVYKVMITLDLLHEVKPQLRPHMQKKTLLFIAATNAIRAHMAGMAAIASLMYFRETNLVRVQTRTVHIQMQDTLA